MNINIHHPFIRLILNHIQKYNHEKYWAMRSHVINPDSKKPKLLKCWYLLKIKRIDAFHNASMGTDLNSGAVFSSPPHLLHGLNGIIIGHNATFGDNVTICQQVTVMHGSNDEGSVIGNDVFIGAGAKIKGNVIIGNNVTIGANAVVTKNIPDNAVVAGVPAKIIKFKTSGTS